MLEEEDVKRASIESLSLRAAVDRKRRPAAGGRVGRRVSHDQVRHRRIPGDDLGRRFSTGGRALFRLRNQAERP
jgi:hypothetical protein